MDEAMAHCRRGLKTWPAFVKIPDGGQTTVGEHRFSCVAGVGALRK
jgi:hypothetical protein